MARDRTVTVKYTPPKTDHPILDMASIRIEIDEDCPDEVWIWLIEDGIKVEGGSFPLEEFMAAIFQFYNNGF